MKQIFISFIKPELLLSEIQLSVESNLKFVKIMTEMMTEKQTLISQGQMGTIIVKSFFLLFFIKYV